MEKLIWKLSKIKKLCLCMFATFQGTLVITLHYFIPSLSNSLQGSLPFLKVILAIKLWSPHPISADSCYAGWCQCDDFSNTLAINLSIPISNFNLLERFVAQLHLGPEHPYQLLQLQDLKLQNLFLLFPNVPFHQILHNLYMQFINFFTLKWTPLK